MARAHRPGQFSREVQEIQRIPGNRALIQINLVCLWHIFSSAGQRRGALGLIRESTCAARSLAGRGGGGAGGIMPRVSRSDHRRHQHRQQQATQGKRKDCPVRPHRAGGIRSHVPHCRAPARTTIRLAQCEVNRDFWRFRDTAIAVRFAANAACSVAKGRVA